MGDEATVLARTAIATRRAVTRRIRIGERVGATVMRSLSVGRAGRRPRGGHGPGRVRPADARSDGYPVVVELRCYLGHGASGSAASMTPFVNGLQSRGIAATAIDLPKRRAEDALPAFHEVVPREPWAVVGGQSYGGRVASLAAAQADAPYAALVLFCYPLHPPGSPDKAAARTSHWPAIRCPVLLLSGESDPFARIDLLRVTVPTLGGPHELVTYPGVGHGLAPVLEDALDRVAAFLATHAAGDSGAPLP